jgi:hypothetical protein
MDEAGRIRSRLQALDLERLALERHLDELERSKAEPVAIAPTAAPVTSSSPAADKAARFRRHFGGRTDVFPARWDNPKTGRSDYARAPIAARLRAA